MQPLISFLFSHDLSSSPLLRHSGDSLLRIVYLVSQKQSDFFQWLLKLLLIRFCSIIQDSAGTNLSFGELVQQNYALKLLPSLLFTIATSETIPDGLIQPIDTFLSKALHILVAPDGEKKSIVGSEFFLFKTKNPLSSFNLVHLLSHIAGRLSFKLIQESLIVDSTSSIHQTNSLLGTPLFKSGFTPTLLQRLSADEDIDETLQLEEDPTSQDYQFILSLIEGEGEGKKFLDILEKFRGELCPEYNKDPLLLKLQRYAIACVIRRANKIQICREICEYDVASTEDVELLNIPTWLFDCLKEAQSLKSACYLMFLERLKKESGEKTPEESEVAKKDNGERKKEGGHKEDEKRAEEEEKEEEKKEEEIIPVEESFLVPFFRRAKLLLGLNPDPDLEKTAPSASRSLGSSPIGLLKKLKNSFGDSPKPGKIASLEMYVQKPLGLPEILSATINFLKHSSVDLSDIMQVVHTRTKAILNMVFLFPFSSESSMLICFSFQTEGFKKMVEYLDISENCPLGQLYMLRALPRAMKSPDRPLQHYLSFSHDAVPVKHVVACRKAFETLLKKLVELLRKGDSALRLSCVDALALVYEKNEMDLFERISLFNELMDLIDETGNQQICLFSSGTAIYQQDELFSGIFPLLTSQNNSNDSSRRSPRCWASFSRTTETFSSFGASGLCCARRPHKYCSSYYLSLRKTLFRF